MIITSCLEYVFVCVRVCILPILRYSYCIDIHISICSLTSSHLGMLMPGAVFLTLQDCMALWVNFQRTMHLVRLGLRLRSEKNTKDFDELSLKLNCAEKL